VDRIYTPSSKYLGTFKGGAMSSEQPIRIVITGGGTGGHVQPAIAVVDELRRRGLPLELLWIGSAKGEEKWGAEQHGIPFKAIQTGKLRRYFAWETFVDTAKLPIGSVQAFVLLQRFKPDVIFSTGSYVSVPVVFAGARIAPILTHEQTAVLGLATKINLRFADVLAVSFDQSLPMAAGFRGKAITTGNPVRGAKRDGDARRGYERFGFDPALPFLYVTGGSRGASAINDRIGAILPELLKTTQVLHQTGPKLANNDFATLSALRDRLSPELRARYQVREFIGEELPDVYAAASLIVGRAGAGTVADLAFVGKPGIIIPLPGTGGDEQGANARAIATAGGAIVIREEDAAPERLLAELTALLADSERLRTMGQSAAILARPNATSDLADELLKLAGRGA
jgi:UDP-N-acetylglucosamine--N-acetylmuramyl-(pentapeptide) pyrophosphoryl-undecaprenol N-acetylglucosamine transferase